MLPPRAFERPCNPVRGSSVSRPMAGVAAPECAHLDAVGRARGNWFGRPVARAGRGRAGGRGDRHGVGPRAVPTAHSAGVACAVPVCRGPGARGSLRVPARGTGHAFAAVDAFARVRGPRAGIGRARTPRRPIPSVLPLPVAGYCRADSRWGFAAPAISISMTDPGDGPQLVPYGVGQSPGRALGHAASSYMVTTLVARLTVGLLRAPQRGEFPSYLFVFMVGRVGIEPTTT